MIKVLFDNGGYPVSLAAVKKITMFASKLECKIKGEVEINIVDKITIKKLNKKFRNKNKVTDVLSFAWQEDKIMPGKLLGQIFICYDQIVVQAKEYGVTVRSEFGRMLVHGLLHLVGYDHADNYSAKKMFTTQDKILKGGK